MDLAKQKTTEMLKQSRINSTLIPNQKTISMLVFIGSFWGFTEYFAGTLIKDSFPDGVTGSILIGLSFFFLASGLFFSKNIYGILIPLGVAIALKIGWSIISGHALSHPSLINPLFSILIETAVFISFYLLFLKKKKKSIAMLIILGAAGGVLVSLLFPQITAITALPVCVKLGTNTPLSIYFINYSIIAGSIALPLGIKFSAFLKQYAEMESNKSLTIALNTLSFIFILFALQVFSL